jgi:hypothetical protein
MDYFAGLDVSVKDTSICIVDDTGKIVREVKVASEPDALLAVLGNPAYHFKRVGLEAGPLSQWLHAYPTSDALHRETGEVSVSGWIHHATGPRPQSFDEGKRWKGRLGNRPTGLRFSYAWGHCGCLQIRNGDVGV